MRDSAQRLGRIVDDLFLLARADAGHLPLRRESLYLEDVVDEAARAVRTLAHERGVRIQLLPLNDSPYDGDADLLGRVLLNLLDNAIKYGPDGQTVTVTLNAPTVADPVLRLTVDDQGRGVPARDRRRVWTPFVRLEDRAGSTGGSGLGLSVVRDLARRHGGRVEILDAPGGGARLLLALPQDDVADDAPLRLASG